MQRLPAFFLLLVLLASFVPSASVSAQVRPLASSGERTLILISDSLWIIDGATAKARNAGRPTWIDAFEPTTLPNANSGAWDPQENVFWLWDYSVGSTIKLSPEGEVLAFSPRRSSHVQYQHAGGLHPISRTPVAYGGYGYYRTKEFMVSYSPEADTWLEVPYPAPPQARTNSVMISGLDDRHIVVVGGQVARPGTFPPLYNLPADEALAFDFLSSTWRKLRYDPWMMCPVEHTRNNLGDVPTWQGKALLLWPEYCALPFATGSPSKISVVTWNPFSGEVALLGSVEDLPSPHRLVALFMDETATPVVIVSRGTMDSGAPLLQRGTIVAQSATLRLSRAAGIPWTWLTLLLSASGLAWVVILRSRRVSIQVHVGVGRLTFQKGLHRHSVSPSPSVVQLCAVLASRTGGRHIPAEVIGDHFDRMSTDPDAARVAKNRALNDLNELSAGLGFGFVIERVRSSADRRKFDYQCRASFRLAESPTTDQQ